MGKNHLWERIFIRRDEISGDESSLGEDFFQHRDEISGEESSLEVNFYPQG